MVMDRNNENDCHDNGSHVIIHTCKYEDDT
jgi:hypothetical protein